MPVTFVCPRCRHALAVSRRFAGRSGLCPKCRAPFRVPEGPPAAGESDDALPAVEWTDLAQPIVDAIKGALAEGGAALGPAFEPEQAREDDGVVARIVRILEDEVRPAVAMDGGDIVFSAFRDGIVELYLQGSCSGCPSSTATLKLGIEARLREAIPEVQGVIAL